MRGARESLCCLFYQIMNFLTSAVWIFLSSHILRQPCLFAQPATTPLLTRRSARLETITNHVQNYQSWLTSQISSCVFTFADYVQIFHTKSSLQSSFLLLEYCFSVKQTRDVRYSHSFRGFGMLQHCQLPTKRTSFRSFKLQRPVFMKWWPMRGFFLKLQ